MNQIVFVAFACLAVASASNIILKGPSGVITDEGPIGPAGQHHGDGHWGGWDDGHWGNGHWDNGHWDNGHWDDGHWDDGHWDDNHGHYSDVVSGNGAKLVGASLHRNGDNGHHGVVVRGPPTAPADIVGPSGKVLSKGLWGPIHGHGHGHHGW